jgi:hypothetical protein
VTDEEAVLALELRLHGVHPDWVKWAITRHATGMARFMLDTIEGKHTLAANLVPNWKRPMTPAD